MEGFENGTFRPDQKLTRAQAAQLVYRLLATPDNGTGACSYTDIAGSGTPSPRALSPWACLSTAASSVPTT